MAHPYDAYLDAIPYSRLLGMRIEAVSRDEVLGSLGWSEQLCTAGGVLHGGALMSFADTLGAVCAFLNLSADSETTMTVESSSRFFRGLRSGVARGRASPVHIGSRFVTVQCDVHDDAGALLGRVTQTQAVLRPRE